MAIKKRLCDDYLSRLLRDHKGEFVTNPGDPLEDTYDYKYIDGVKQLVKVGKTNVQDLIDSYAEVQDLHVMIGKFLNGDDSVIRPEKGQFGDFTKYPKTYAELFQRVNDCERIFDSLPVEMREKFDNSYVKFWEDFGSDHFNSVLFPEDINVDEPATASVDSEVK